MPKITRVAGRRSDMLDRVMDPGLDGQDTFRHIRDRHPGQAAIIASGFSETERAKTALDLG